MSSKSHFFRGGVNLVAQYDFNNNLIDIVGGNNGSGSNISYQNNELVFNRANNSRVLINNLGAFNFTDGVNDLPFKIETSVVLNSLPSNNANPSNFIIGKRDNTSTLQNYQFIVRERGFEFYLLSSNPNAYIAVSLLFSQNLLLNQVYNITVEYDGSKTNTGLKMIVNASEQIGNLNNGQYTGQELTGSNVYLGIAGFGIATNRLYFDGKMDYLKIYK